MEGSKKKKQRVLDDSSSDESEGEQRKMGGVSFGQLPGMAEVDFAEIMMTGGKGQLFS